MANLRKRENKDGVSRWQVRWREPSGKQTSQDFPSENEAIVFRGLVDAAGQRSPKGWVPGRGFHDASNPTLAEWFVRAVAARSDANDRTRADYIRDFGNHVPDWMATTPIDLITREDVGKWLSWLQSRGLKPKTIHNLHAMMSSVMKDAVADELIGRNPFYGKSKAVPIKHEEMCFLTSDEFEVLLGCLTEHYRPFIRFLFGTGLRWGEATALTVRNVDLTNARIHIVTAWKRQATGPDKSSEPKTRRSRRTVTLTPRLVELLRPYVDGKADDDLVWVNTVGDRITTAFYDAWNVARRKANEAGLSKRPRIHDLRHSHASILLNAGVPIIAVSRRLGHASAVTTADRYGHLAPQTDAEMLRDLAFAGL